MFPPQNDQIWNENLRWQAIPIHTVPKELDHVLHVSRPCPLYDQAYNEYLASDEIQSVLKDHQSLIQYIEAHAGEKIHSIEQIKSIYQALRIESWKGFP